MDQTRGFTLIELMITVAIVALLLLLAYPSFSTYLVKGQRIAAIQGLYQLQLDQEEWRVSHASYATQQQASANLLPNQKHYTFSVLAANASYYQLQVTAKAGSPQQADKVGNVACHTLTLDRNDVKAPLACWE
ncbi:MAG: prepilin-type N-terminal cleavage/methylation domain-containing protein [Aeromonadales bacterium]|nr:prepilin-type N-terminal cleavage/methylation domain-containing protein [Aeromonadales bacterium]